VTQYRKPAIDKFIDAQFDGARRFRRTLSYREFVTAFSLAMVLVVLYNSIRYFHSEDWMEDKLAFVTSAMFVLVTPLNHVFYRIEHKRQNNFLGRNLHDYMFFIAYALIQQIVLVAIEGEFSFGEFLGNVLALSVAVAFLEIVLSGLKRVFKLFRWQPF
jgi:hypothetical protein